MCIRDRFTSQANQTRFAELDRHIASDQIQGVANGFDQRAGKPGAFREEVVRRGVYAFNSTGKDISVQEAVSEVIGLYGNNEMAPQPAPIENGEPVVIQQQPVVIQKKPTIPRVRAGGHSPARKLPRSIDDLKRAAAAFD